MKLRSTDTIFLVQTITGKEDLFRRHIENFTKGEVPFQMLIPKRELTERKRGVAKKVTKTIFPSYVFIAAEDLTPDDRLLIRRTPGYIRLMKDRDGKLIPLRYHDRQLLVRLISSGETTPRSIVRFDKKNRVVPLSGPLKNCEGTIIKIDRRKQRAKVKIQMHDKAFIINFEYQEIEKVKDSEPGKN